ncbi:MAG TPA: tetratricopeptide repeat protein [Flexilinea sp.]|nr:tetratricopeptide repeat protein [Flexilinea sp.]
MKNIFKKITGFRFSEAYTPWLILAACILAYGLMIPWIGFYWDDLPFTWIYHTFGSAGLAKYFATKRPALGQIYQVTMPIIGTIPWKWQVFGLFWRWISAVILWAFLRSVWPNKRFLAICTAFLFAVYPGFDQTYIPIAFSHYFLTESLFFLSLWLTVLATRLYLKNGREPRFFVFLGLSLILSVINLITTEYFFLLELVRPFFIWVILSQQPDHSHTFKRIIRFEIPYLFIFLCVCIWRLFFFEYQTYNYSPVLWESFKSDPVNTVISLFKTVIHDIWLVSAQAWAKAFTVPNIVDLGKNNWLRYWLIVIGSFLFYLFFFYKSNEKNTPDLPAENSNDDRSALQAMGIGLFAVFIAGWPYWGTDLPIALGFPNSRFTLSFMLGVSLFIAGIINLWHRRLLRIILASLLIAFGIGLQFQISLDYRVDWNNHKRMIWQMTWRIPALTQHTAILGNYEPPMHYSDNSLSAELNSIYAPENKSDEMSYMYYFPELREKTYLANFEPNRPITHDYLVATFHGNTSQVLAVYYHPRFCFRVLDPELDPINPLLPEDVRKAAGLSSTKWIETPPESQSVQPDPSVYGREPDRGNWCYTFERADLARQQGNQTQAAEILRSAIDSDVSPRTPSEWLLPIEVFAQTGDWQRAIDLTDRALIPTYEEQPSLLPVICRLWQRIDQNTQASEEKSLAVDRIKRETGCPFESSIPQ